MTDSQYAAVMGKLTEVLIALKGGAHAPSAAAGGAAGPKIASDADLDGPNGDPAVKFPPKSWKGPNYSGRKFSDCPADFLLVLAEFLEWKGNSPLPGKEKYARFDLLDAARARGWAARPMTDAGTPPAIAGALPDDHIPF